VQLSEKSGLEKDMKTAVLWLDRQIAIGLVLLLAAPFGVAASAQEAPSAPPPQTRAPAPASVPNSVPATNQPANGADEVASLPDSPTPTASQTAPQENPPQTAPQQQPAPNQPMGTAAAPSEPASGVAASRPAGAAIAPAKQKRSRTFAIRLALIVGAAVAVGTVVGLSSASPSRP
jgi:hypothetical protein